MFLSTVPIEQHESARFVHDFPRSNRDGVMQTWDDVKKQLGRAGGQGFTYVDVLSDFHLLFFLTAFLDLVRTRLCSTERRHHYLRPGMVLRMYAPMFFCGHSPAPGLFSFPPAALATRPFFRQSNNIFVGLSCSRFSSIVVS